MTPQGKHTHDCSSLKKKSRIIHQNKPEDSNVTFSVENVAR